MRIPLWEWGVARDMRSNPVGVSGTRHGAMAALSRALVQAGQPARGNVVPVVLIDAAGSEPHYFRFPALSTAIYDRDVIRWDTDPPAHRQERDPWT